MVKRKGIVIILLFVMALIIVITCISIVNNSKDKISINQTLKLLSEGDRNNIDVDVFIHKFYPSDNKLIPANCFDKCDIRFEYLCQLCRKISNGKMNYHKLENNDFYYVILINIEGKNNQHRKLSLIVTSDKGNLYLGNIEDKYEKTIRLEYLNMPLASNMIELINKILADT